MRLIGIQKLVLLSGLLLYIAAGAVPLQKDIEPDWKSRLTEEERAGISRPDSPNDRVKTYLRFAEQRLRNARALVDREEHSAAGQQVAAYTALIADAGNFTRVSVPKRGKAHKTLETNLREQTRIVQGLRRDMLISQAGIMDEALRVISQVRRQSLNLFIGEDRILSESEKPK